MTITVYAFAKLDQRRGWVIPHCPFCAKRHIHGAGGADDDPREFLGGRVPHCATRTDRRGAVIWQKPSYAHYVLTEDSRLHGQVCVE